MRKLNVYAAESLRKLDVNFKFQQDSVKIPQCGNLIFHPVGCIVYGSARPSYLKMLNTIHHQGLRLALGAFRTSPVESLYVEAGELPLELRRIKLSLQYITK